MVGSPFWDCKPPAPEKSHFLLAVSVSHLLASTYFCWLYQLYHLYPIKSCQHIRKKWMVSLIIAYLIPIVIPFFLVGNSHSITTEHWVQPPFAIPIMYLDDQILSWWMGYIISTCCLSFYILLIFLPLIYYILNLNIYIYIQIYNIWIHTRWWCFFVDQRLFILRLLLILVLSITRKKFLRLFFLRDSGDIYIYNIIYI